MGGFLFVSGRNYPGGEAMAVLHSVESEAERALPHTVHIGVCSRMLARSLSVSHRPRVILVVTLHGCSATYTTLAVGPSSHSLVPLSFSVFVDCLVCAVRRGGGGHERRHSIHGGDGRRRELDVPRFSPCVFVFRFHWSAVESISSETTDIYPTF